jgi:tryptophan-rich sensory protein
MSIALFLTFFASAFAAASSGAFFPTGDWYKSLRKPMWVPPNWAFPLVWTTLYILMSWAAMRVGMSGAEGAVMAQALGLWALQIALNAIWTPVFFGLHRMRAAVLIMAGLWTSVLGTGIAFYAIDHIAGLMIAPYVLWVSIAFALNVSLVRLNPLVSP